MTSWRRDGKSFGSESSLRARADAGGDHHLLVGARRSLALEFHLVRARIILHVVRLEDDRAVLVRRELDDLKLD